MNNKILKKISKILFVIFLILFTLSFLIAWKKAVNLGDYPYLDNAVWPTKNGFYFFTKGEKHRSFDDNGILYWDYGGNIGKQYNPVSIAQYVLSLVSSPDDNEIRIILRHLDFLISYAHRTPQGNLVYPYNFDWKPDNQIAPWYSAMAQGQVASALLWGNRLTNNPKYYDAAKESILALAENNNKYHFYKELKEGGLWLKEYPNNKWSVLDGSLAAIAGVYDLWRMMSHNDPTKDKITDLLKNSLLGFKNSSIYYKSYYFGHYFSDKKEIPSPSYFFSNLAWLHYISTYDREIVVIRESYFKYINFFKKIMLIYRNSLIGRLLYVYMDPCF